MSKNPGKKAKQETKEQEQKEDKEESKKFSAHGLNLQDKTQKWKSDIYSKCIHCVEKCTNFQSKPD